MNRCLRTWIRTTQCESTNNTKVDAASKLRARELRHIGRKGNRLKREKGYLDLGGLSISQ
jgi:hypothetical protein